MTYEILINGTKRSVAWDSASMAASIDGRKIHADVAATSSGAYSVLLDGRVFEVTVEKDGDGWLLRTEGREFHVRIADPRSLRRGRDGSVEMEGRQQIIAPMPGKIVRLLAAPGQKVELGQGLLVIEAMKMQNEIRSPKSGTVERVAREGQTVTAGEILAVVV
ncbi:MAG TPA: biotin/lipoyl-containing protein [Candidatus Dormibacteraeota bacterium]|nr:biotin/lipoyl-containing protein [Candidatus Dormibacteraeota bacterium]